MSVAYALRTLQVLYSIPRFVFAFTVCVTYLISLIRFRKLRFLLRITLFGKKREKLKASPLGVVCQLQLYRLFDGNDQATVSCLSADQGYELVVAVTEGQTIYPFLPVHVDQDLVFNLFNERALDV